MSHAVILPSAPCSRLLLFPTVDIVLTLVAFMGEYPSLVLAQMFALSVQKLAVAAGHVRAGCLRTRTICLDLLVLEGLLGWDGVRMMS